MKDLKNVINKIIRFIKSIFSNEIKIEKNSNDKKIKNNLKNISNSKINISNSIQGDIHDKNRDKY